MKPGRLATVSQYAACFDTETHKVQPGLVAPPVVCGSWATNGGAGILTKEQSLEYFTRVLNDPRIVLVGQNIAFDVIVKAQYAATLGIDLMPKIMQMYDDGRVYDIGVAEQLHAIAGGHLLSDPRTGGKLVCPESGKFGVGYRLSVLLDLVTGRKNAKANDRFRLSYALLDDVPMSEWPPDALAYPVDDAQNTLEICLVQLTRNRNLHDLSNQVFADLCLQLGGAQGFRVDPTLVRALELKTEERRELNIQEFIDADFFAKNKQGELIYSKTTGSEKKDLSTVRGMLCDAYGVTGVCSNCDGTCRVPGQTKHKACDGLGCDACNMIGKVDNPKTTKGCPRCDGTGRDLDTAPIPRTEKGAIQYGRDPLQESGDELLMKFAEFGEADKIGSTYLPWLRSGIGDGDTQIPMTLRPNVLLATGRVSYSGVVQLLPRKGGVRDCIKYRDGWTMVSADYKGLELVTHAQSCLNILGRSRLADILNSGKDAHSSLGADMAGFTYDDFVTRLKSGEKRIKDYRQAAKPGNFGFPGGMGAPTMVLTQRKADFDTFAPDGTKYKGVRFCLLIGGAQHCGEVKVTKWGRAQMPPTCKKCIECAETLRDSWFKTYPENRAYFKHISEICDTKGEMVQHVSNRIRGGISFCSAANSYFQALGADVTKEALRRVTAEQYADRSSALYGSRTILMAHDELIIAAREAQQHEAAMRLSQVMVDCLQEYCPDLADAAEAEPALMEYWHKGAEAVYNDNGKLIPWEPTI